jgi:Transposase DDE domain
MPSCCGGRKSLAITEVQFNQLDGFVAYADKQFELNLLAGCFATDRADPHVPDRAVGLSLLLGEVVHIPSLLQLEQETQLPQWQQWTGHHQPISHDTLGYASNRMNPESLRRAGVFINRKLKRGKAFEASKVHGLLTASLDANEQFCSDHRCCADCLSREVVCKDDQGNEFRKTQYYHKQVYAQLSGPRLSVILEVEPMRQGEEECAAALRLLRRMRKKYGPRFFDLVVVDSWYTNGPFLKTVAQELGWPVVAVLKQERYEIYQEALALTQGQPTQAVQRGEGPGQRRVEVWDVRSLRLSDTYTEAVRVVRVRESWTERTRQGQEWKTVEKEQHWIWVVAGDLDAYEGAQIRDFGHLRWKIENNAFGQLTQHWHLTHVAHHKPVAVLALLWIKIIAFTLFHAFAILHGKLFRLGKVTLQELRQRIYRSLLCGWPIPYFSG